MSQWGYMCWILGDAADWIFNVVARVVCIRSVLCIAVCRSTINKSTCHGGIMATFGFVCHPIIVGNENMGVSLLVFLISVGILWCLEIKLHVRPINMQLQPPNKKWHPNQYLSFDLMVPSPITYHRKYAPLSSNLCGQVNQCWLWSALCQRSTKTPYAAPTRPPPNIRNHNQYLIINIHWSIIYCRKHLPLSLILPQHALFS